MDHETTIGLEVHVQLKTASKLFCSCEAAFGGAPNRRTCPVCTGQPGALPVLNGNALRLTVAASLALGSRLARRFRFDRKCYFYPDLPKGYQITQHAIPLATGGSVAIVGGEECEKRIPLRGAHLEEDAGKTVRPEGAAFNLVDLNRAGIPLLEIVTEPAIASPREAHAYLDALKRLLRHAAVSDCDMEKGSLRCDANISLRLRGAEKLGMRTEIKNLNSFRNVERALAFERERHASLLARGEPVVQETRSFDERTGATAPMRSKEEARDYRYFPEPDLPPFTVPEALIEEIEAGLPELPLPLRRRFIGEFGLDRETAGILTDEPETARFFEECARASGDAPEAARWIRGPVMAAVNRLGVPIGEIALTGQGVAELIVLVRNGALSRQAAAKILALMAESGKSAAAVMKEEELEQLSDGEALARIVDAVLASSPDAAAAFRGGKPSALNALIGRVMRESGGRANPETVRALIEERMPLPEPEEG